MDHHSHPKTNETRYLEDNQDSFNDEFLPLASSFTGLPTGCQQRFVAAVAAIDSFGKSHSTGIGARYGQPGGRQDAFRSR